PWTGLPVAGNRAVDQTGIELVDRLVAEPQFVEAARFEVLDEDIRLSEQRPKVVRTLLAFQIESDAPLAPIDASKVRAPRTHERRPRPGIVAFGRFFDLDDVGAHVAEEHGAKGPGEDAGQVDHAKSVKWWHVSLGLIFYSHNYY